jgi:hypothetical protein
MSQQASWYIVNVMATTRTPLPDPAQQAVAVWLRTIDREHLHGAGLIETNKRFHGVAAAARDFVRNNFTNPEQQEAAFDGLALALLAMAHFGDVDRLAHLFDVEGPKEEDAQKNQPADNSVAG